MSRCAEDYFRSFESEHKMKSHIWSLWRKLERTEAKVKELEFMIAVLEEENNKLKNDITPMQNL